MESDFSNIIPATNISVGEFVGKFRWGPLPTIGTSNIGLTTKIPRWDHRDRYHTSAVSPDYWKQASNFLQYDPAFRTIVVRDYDSE